MKKNILLILIMILSGCTKAPQDKPIFITNILEGSKLSYTQAGGGNNALPFMIMSDKRIEDLEVILENEDHEYLMVTELIEVDKESIDLSLPYIYTKYGYDIDKIVDLEVELSKELSIEENLKLTRTLDDLTKISEKTEKEVRSLFDHINIYIVSANFLFDTIHYPTTYTKLVLKDQGSVLHEFNIEVNFEVVENSEKISRATLAPLNMETQLSDSIKFDYNTVFRVNEATEITSYHIDHPNLEIESLYIRHKQNNRINILDLKSDEVNQMNITVEEGDIITFVPTIRVASTNAPFFFGSFKTTIGLEDESYSFDSGLLSSQLDPYIYYGYLIEGLDDYSYLNHLQENYYWDRKETYIEMESREQ